MEKLRSKWYVFSQLQRLFILLSLMHASLTGFFGRVFAYASGFPNRLSVTLKRSPYNKTSILKKKKNIDQES
jgi:hypothetical protein